MVNASGANANFRALSRAGIIRGYNEFQNKKGVERWQAFALSSDLMPAGVTTLAASQYIHKLLC
jgi:hypothetical protein